MLNKKPQKAAPKVKADAKTMEVAAAANEAQLPPLTVDKLKKREDKLGAKSEA